MLVVNENHTKQVILELELEKKEKRLKKFLESTKGNNNRSDTVTDGTVTGDTITKSPLQAEADAIVTAILFGCGTIVRSPRPSDEGHYVMEGFFPMVAFYYLARVKIALDIQGMGPCLVNYVARPEFRYVFDDTPGEL